MLVGNDINGNNIMIIKFILAKCTFNSAMLESNSVNAKLVFADKKLFLKKRIILIRHV